jgi:hypothetical protein
MTPENSSNLFVSRQFGYPIVRVRDREILNIPIYILNKRRKAIQSFIIISTCLHDAPESSLPVSTTRSQGGWREEDDGEVSTRK